MNFVKVLLGGLNYEGETIIGVFSPDYSDEELKEKYEHLTKDYDYTEIELIEIHHK